MENGCIVPDNSVEFTETWQAMEECFKSGLTKHIGLSNFNGKMIDKLCATATVKPHNLQV